MNNQENSENVDEKEYPFNLHGWEPMFNTLDNEGKGREVRVGHPNKPQIGFVHWQGYSILNITLKDRWRFIVLDIPERTTIEKEDFDSLEQALDAMEEYIKENPGSQSSEEQ